jgi:hypothetical protein
MRRIVVASVLGFAACRTETLTFSEAAELLRHAPALSRV